MGNGNELTKEGYLFCGRGYIQLTGKENYTAFGKSIGEDVCANPDVVASKYALLSAAWFFSRHRISLRKTLQLLLQIAIAQETSQDRSIRNRWRKEGQKKCL